jgi:site-specific recombinase XerD
MKSQANFSVLLQRYFTDWLMKERGSSGLTITTYRDTFRLLLRFAERLLKKTPNRLTIPDLDAPFILRFLDHLEIERANSPRTRNVRLAAIHSFFTYVALQEPGFAAVAQRVLAIQTKRFAKSPVDYLTVAESEALLKAPDQKTWSGRRDHTLLLVALQTGLRLSELIGLRGEDVVLSPGAHVRCVGKGRKSRCVPLRKEVVAVLRRWMNERKGNSDEPIFVSARGQVLSRDGIQYILEQHAKRAALKCPSINSKRVSPHILRHSAAMNLLLNGVDRSVIALWLGHESIDTTQIYLHASLELKEKALAKTKPFGGRMRRYQPSDQILAFLQSL